MKNIGLRVIRFLLTFCGFPIPPPLPVFHSSPPPLFCKSHQSKPSLRSPPPIGAHFKGRTSVDVILAKLIKLLLPEPFWRVVTAFEIVLHTAGGTNESGELQSRSHPPPSYLVWRLKTNKPQSSLFKLYVGSNKFLEINNTVASKATAL